MVCQFIRPLDVAVANIEESHVKHMQKIRYIPEFFLLLLTAAVLFSAGSASTSAALRPIQGEELLLDTYHRNMAGLRTNSFGLPLVVKSFERNKIKCTWMSTVF